MSYKDKEKQIKYLKEYYIQNKEKRHKYNLDHKKEKTEYTKKWVKKNKNKSLSYIKKYILKNKNKISKYQKQYSLEHREKRLVYSRKYYLQQHNNEIFKMKRAMYNILRNSTERIKINKWDSTKNILGYQEKELKEYINNQLKKEMTWNNYGKVWHIDHKIPLSWFGWRNNKNDIVNSFKLENLRPLSKEENLQKSNYYCADVLLALSLIGR